MSLTVVLTLKGREEFTYRWMGYMNDIRFPFKILIADGGDDNRLEKHLLEYKNYPNLNYEYIRCPLDLTIEDYYKKLYNALKLVQSKYVLHADNDDFYSLSNIQSHLDFLDKNRDFVASRGSLINLEVFDRNFKPISASVGHAFLCRHVQTQSIDMESHLARVHQLCKGMSTNDYYSNWYSITRTTDLLDIWKNLIELPIKEVIVLEILSHIMMVKAGKVRITSEPFYIRQSYTSSFGDALVKDNDFLERCLTRNGLSEFALAVNLYIETDSVENRTIVLKSISLWLNEFILNINLNRRLTPGRRLLIILKKSKYCRATLFYVKKIKTSIFSKFSRIDRTFEKDISTFLLESKSQGAG